MRRALPLLLFVSACSSIVGIDDWTSSSGPATTGTSSSSGGAGGEGTTNTTTGGTGGGAAGSGGSAGSGGAGGEGGACTPIDCWYGAPVMEAAAACGPGVTSGGCVPIGTDYCACDGNTPAVFVERDGAGNPTAVTLVGYASGEPYSLLVNSTCPGAATIACPATCAGGKQLYRWTDLIVPPDMITSLEVWQKDPADACSSNGGGSVLIHIGGF